ncbi:adenylate kinase family protein [Rubritalea spongiae]|uniref:Adenylate kinase n=1 Tax=Rubritalea spongiae TaxID=430797 RepID=A0ABW5E8T0_9BACT
MHRIILMGPPASGKGTQSLRIQKLLGIPALSTGNLLRREVESGSELGAEVETYLNRGAYVPDALIMKMVAKWLEENVASGWLLDGFPRTLTQAQALENDSAFEAPTLAIALDVPKVVLEGRIIGRRECTECGATVSVQGGSDEKCPECGGELTSRADDDLENFRRRYTNYREQTQPLFDYYAAQGKLLAVDGVKSPDQVFAVIEQHLLS